MYSGCPHEYNLQFGGLVQERRNSIANALELRLFALIHRFLPWQHTEPVQCQDKREQHVSRIVSVDVIGFVFVCIQGGIRKYTSLWH